MKRLFLALSLLAIVLFLGRNLNPFSSSFFTFHDSTQPARIQQFVSNLKSLKIPPRVAPDLNFGLGYPVFNFYAPFSYWITSAINLLSFDVVTSLKISFLMAVLVGFFGSFLFLSIFFDFLPALLGGFFYVLSLYLPLNIFVRGNLAETWFIGLFPLAMFFIYKNSQKYNNKIFVITTLVLSFLLTTHNILSLISLPIVLIFLLLLKNKKQNLTAFFLSLIMTAYFWLPALLEMKYIWAREVATLTDFKDHFLCLGQLWQSPWGFGGSTKGCLTDGMSFMLGKFQIIFAGLGFLLFLFRKEKRNIKLIGWFLLFLTIFSLFMTLYQSQPIWKFFKEFLSIIQFPWRLISFSVLGLAFFSAYFFQYVNIPYKKILIITVLITCLIINGKYFQGQSMNKKSFEKKFLSKSYIEKKAAFAVAEYLPKSIDYQYWRSREFKKNLPMDFVAKGSIEPFNKNKQTTIENIGNIITLIGMSLLLWKITRK